MKLKLNDIVTDAHMTYIVTEWLDNTVAPDDTVRIVRSGVIVYEKGAKDE